MAQAEWPEMYRKRTREDEYADIATGGTLGFTEHRSKRLQALPFRTSPTQKRWSVPPAFPPAYANVCPPAAPHTITPGDSDSEDVAHIQRQDFYEESQIWEPSAGPVAQPPSATATAPDSVDHDMDMVDSESFSTADLPDGPDRSHLQPGSLQPDPIAPSIASRMPTPIHCSFAAQVRGNSWNGARPNTDRMGLGAGGQMDADQAQNIMDHESIPRSLDGAAAAAAVMEDWNMVQNRRLPSPISESGGEDSLGSPVMVLGTSPHHHLAHLAHANQHGHAHPLLSGLPPRSSSAMELGKMGDSPPSRSCTPTADGSSGNAMDVESPATPSPKKGHTRSRHTLNSWTAMQPGMKKSFSIGYRADCEKCRMKVPGHFNHIIIS